MGTKVEIEVDDDIMSFFTDAQKLFKEKFNLDLTLTDCLNEGVSKMFMLSHLSVEDIATSLGIEAKNEQNE